MSNGHLGGGGFKNGLRMLVWVILGESQENTKINQEGEKKSKYADGSAEQVRHSFS